jgi:hypothetical protein
MHTAVIEDRRRQRKGSFKNEELLEFEVKFARTADPIGAIAGQRFRAFEHHYSFEESFAAPKIELKDKQKGNLLIYAEDKRDRTVLGSIRISTNVSRPFSLEFDPLYPQELMGLPLALLSRFVVDRTVHAKNVRFALLKASLMYCHSKQLMNWIILADDLTGRLYSRIGFKRLIQNFVPKGASDAPNALHLYSGHIPELTSYVSNRNSELFEFVTKRFHPDIRVFDSVEGEWAVPRRG